MFKGISFRITRTRQATRADQARVPPVQLIEAPTDLHPGGCSARSAESTRAGGYATLDSLGHRPTWLELIELFATPGQQVVIVVARYAAVDPDQKKAEASREDKDPDLNQSLDPYSF